MIRLSHRLLAATGIAVSTVLAAITFSVVTTETDTETRQDAGPGGMAKETWPGNQITGEPSALDYRGSPTMFARGVDGRLVHYWKDGDVLHQDIWPGELISDPVAVQWGNDLHVWASGRGAVLQSWTWSPETGFRQAAIAGGVVGRPAVVMAFGVPNVFAKGTDGQLHRWWRAGEAWEHALWGKSPRSDVEAVSTNDRLLVFGSAQDGTLMHWSSSATGPLKYETQGGGVVGRPSVLNVGGVPTVFARGTHGMLRRLSYEAGAGTWKQETWQGAAAGEPTAFASGKNGLHVFARGTSDALDHWSQQAGALRDVWRDQTVAGKPSVFADGDRMHIVYAGRGGQPEHVWWDPALSTQPPIIDAAPEPSVTAVPLFNRPEAYGPPKREILDYLLNQVNTAATGSDVRITGHYFQLPDLTNALLDAHHRGVNVKVVAQSWDLIRDPVDPEKGHKLMAEIRRLEEVIGTDTGFGSWVVRCPPVQGACIAPGGFGKPNNAHMHNKFFLFSDSAAGRNVVLQSTENPSAAGGGFLSWNTAVAVTENKTLYNSYAGYFDDLSSRRLVPDYSRKRPPVQAGLQGVRYFPQATGTDPIVTQLRNVRCTGNTSGGTGDHHRTAIRLGASFITSTEIARELYRLRTKGCHVSVTATKMNDDVARTLLLAPITLRCFTTADPAPPGSPHMKYFSIDGHFEGKKDRKLVFLGSRNFGPNSLRNADETQLKVEDGNVHDSFAAFHGMVTEKAPLAGNKCGGGTLSTPDR